MSSSKLAVLAAFLAPILSLVSCVETTGSYRAPGFTPDLLAVRGVSIGTLGSEAPGPNLGTWDRQRLAAELAGRISKNDYAKNDKVFLTDAPGGFVLNATLTRNDVDRWVSNDFQTYEEKIRDEDGRVIGCVTHTTYTTTANTRRLVEGDFQLVDPIAGDVVWAWSGSTSLGSSRSNESGFCYPPAPLFPEPPGTGEVGADLMRGAVRKLTARP
ncbi:MAG: hypothetical protein ABL994_22425 [Verrucomicrobiales bacterium]